MTQISITRALTRVKVIEKQLEQLSYDKYVRSVLEQDKDKKQSEDFKAESKSNFDKFNSLFDESVALQKAIRKSNEDTLVKISGKEMTVSEALILKSLIEHKQQLLSNIRDQNSNTNNEIEKAETQIESKAQSFVQSLKTENQSQIDDAMKVGRLSATKELRKVRLTGLNVEQILKEDLEFVQEFLVEVDYVLSESNATTLIEI